MLAAVGTGFLSFGLWVHHMFATGLPQISLAFFSAASEAVAIPTGVQIFAFLATMLAGRVVFSTPMLFGIGGVAVFVIGGLTGVMVALAPFDWQAHDSYFVVAHLHYVLIGGMLFPLVAGLYYYFPLIGGRKLSDRLGRIAFWLMFAGINLAFFPMHVSGLAGMPRRVFTYPEASGWGALNLASTLGAFVLAAGILVVVADVLRPKRRQPRRGPQPVERRDARMGQRPGGELGRALGAAGAEPLPALGAARAPCRDRSRALVPARCRGGLARGADHLGARRRARAVPAHRRQLVAADALRRRPRGGVRRADLPLVAASRWSSPA